MSGERIEPLIHCTAHPLIPSRAMLHGWGVIPESWWLEWLERVRHSMRGR